MSSAFVCTQTFSLLHRWSTASSTNVCSHSVSWLDVTGVYC